MHSAIVYVAAFLCMTPLASAAGIATLNLSSDGKQITGSVGSGKRTMTVQDGKLEGSRFSFVTVRKGKKGEARILWIGMLDGDTIRGSRSREGAKRGASFVAKRT